MAAKRDRHKNEQPAPEGGWDARPLIPRGGVLVILLVILAFGGFLRFYKLSYQSLWSDELWTWQIANKPTLYDVLYNSRLAQDVYPPLHFVFHYFLQKYVGDSEAVLRFPSAVAGWLTIYAVFLLGRRLYTEHEGLIAAALTAVAWVMLRYSQEARAYAMLVLFVTLAAWLWMDIIRRYCDGRAPRPRTLVGFAACVLAAGMLHYYGLLFVGLLGLGGAAVLVLRRRWGAFGRLCLLYLPLAAAYVWWLPVMMRSLRIQSFWIDRPGPLKFLNVLCFFLNYSKPMTWIAVGLFAALIARTIIDRVRRGPGAATEGTPHAGLFLVLWLLAPYVLVYAKSVLSVPILSNRNLLIVLPACFILLARAVTRLPLPRLVIVPLAVALVLGVLADVHFRIHYYQAPWRDQVREATAVMLKHERRFPDSVVIGQSYGADFFDYYFRRLGSARRVALNVPPVRGGEAVCKKIAEVDAFIAEKRPAYIWLLYANRMPEPEFMAHMKTRYTAVAAEAYLRAGAVVFRNQRPPPAAPAP